MIDPNIEIVLRAKIGQSLRIAGVDEVGRGPWAGPVTACAVVLDPNNIPDGLADSKALSAKKRDALFEPILASADVGLAHVSVQDIDRINILNASLLAMKLALEQLKRPAQFALIDGNKTPPDLNLPSECLIKGDARCLIYCSGVHRCQSHTRSNDGGACATVSGVWLGNQRWIRHKGPPRGAEKPRRYTTSSPFLQADPQHVVCLKNV